MAIEKSIHSIQNNYSEESKILMNQMLTQRNLLLTIAHCDKVMLQVQLISQGPGNNFRTLLSELLVACEFDICLGCFGVFRIEEMIEVNA
jgi:hypothetical protein